jgi:uncharacterized membrane protein
MYRYLLVSGSMGRTLRYVTVQTAVFVTIVGKDKAGNVHITGTMKSSGKAMSITYSECVLLALFTQHALRMHRIVICGLYGCIIYLSIIL